MHNHHHEDPYSRQGRPPWAGAMTDDQPYRRRRGRGRGFGPGSPGSFFGQGPRANRGDIRAAILALLAERPMHGYQIIQEITDRSGGVWAPSPGSVYPTLQHLEDEGLVTADTTEPSDVAIRFFEDHPTDISVSYIHLGGPKDGSNAFIGFSTKSGNVFTLGNHEAAVQNESSLIFRPGL